MSQERPDGLAPLAFLFGTWRGEGSGGYPTVEDFSYTEALTFSHFGKPLLVSVQRTRNLADGQPSHAETGFWRLAAPDTVELVAAHPTGHVEVAEGTLQGTTIDLVSTAVAATSTASDVSRLERSISVDGDVLRYRLDMAAVGEPLSRHLEAELHRVFL